MQPDNSTKNTKEKKDKGKIGEDFCCAFLQKNNFELIGRNVRHKRQELDIIAKKNNRIFIVEVKSYTHIFPKLRKKQFLGLFETSLLLFPDVSISINLFLFCLKTHEFQFLELDFEDLDNLL